MKITHTQLFMDSLSSPKKLGAFRLLPIGKVIQYVFLLILIVTAFSFGQFSQTGVDEIFAFDTIQDYAANIEWLVYPIAVLGLFIMNSLIIFGKISLYALAGWLLLKPMNRRGEYRQVWRTAAFAITWATILTIVFTIFPLSNILTTLVSIFITMLFLIIGFTKYPLLRKAV